MREILQEATPRGARLHLRRDPPEIFEYDRFNTTVANAVGSPGDRLRRPAGQELQGEGYAGDLLLLHSGRVDDSQDGLRYPVRLAASGIAAGAIAARHSRHPGGAFPNAIGLDMGGTSTDICLVHGGELRVTKEWSVEYGYPIIFPSIEVLTIEAGGGSLAWPDEAGSIANGPRVGGADPGPACYDTGGIEPTNSDDANVVLGRLGSTLAGGAKQLRPELAKHAIVEKIATPLGLELAEAAGAIVKVANANMADAVRLVSIRRGLDARLRPHRLRVWGAARSGRWRENCPYRR